MKITRKFAPTTITFETEAELKDFQDALWAALTHIGRQRSLWSVAGVDSKQYSYVESLMKELR